MRYRIIYIFIFYSCFLISGCKKTPNITRLTPTVGIKSFSIEYKDDSIKIYKGIYQKRHHELVYRFYKKGENYYADTFGDEELIMSNSIFGDSLYKESPEHVTHRTFIDKINNDYFYTYLYIENPNKYPSIKLVYDNNYQIISIQQWDVYNIYK